jgi:hypothetical protein
VIGESFRLSRQTRHGLAKYCRNGCGGELQPYIPFRPGMKAPVRPEKALSARSEFGELSPQWRGSLALPPYLAPRATKSSLSAARCAMAAIFLQKVLQILPPIVEGNFLPRLDSTQCYDHYPAPSSHWFCIRSAGMIDVTCHVPPRRAVDGPSLVELEHISRAARLAPISFLCGNAPAAVGRDIDPSFNRLCREQPSPVAERPTRKEREDLVRE